MTFPPSILTALTRLKVLSNRRLSVTVLLVASAGLFFTVLFVALPSARILVWPRVNIVSHTANVVLVRSGAVLDFSPKNTLPMLPIRADIRHEMTFAEISRKFLGENAVAEMTLINDANEQYSLRAGTRLVNQAGMIFRTIESIDLPPATVIEPGSVRVMAEAMPIDLYGEIVGERGNIPIGLKWEIPGLSLEERKLVYGRNTSVGTGGTSVYGTELREQDIDLAERQLKQELLSRAKIRTEEEVEKLRGRSGEGYTVLQYDVLTVMTYSGFVLPVDLIGQSVESIPLEGTLLHETLIYSKDALFEMLLPGLLDHIEEGQELVGGSAMVDGVAVHVIEYDDDLQWVKITAELTGKQRAVLDPLSMSGREFGERAREAIRGKTVREAKRIIQNFPEVERVTVKVWPPWRDALPSLPGNILLAPQ